MNSLYEKMNTIRETRFMDNLHHKYTNCVQLNGYLISKPKQKVLTNGKEIMTFYLIHLHKGTFTFYPCQVFSKPIIREIEQIKNCCLINVLGRLVYNRNSTYSVQVEEISVAHEFIKLELEPPYEKEKKDNGDQN